MHSVSTSTATAGRKYRSKCGSAPSSTLMIITELTLQSFELRRASGPTAASGMDGDLIVTGRTGRVVETEKGVRAFAGLAPDLFAGDAMALGEFRTALFEKDTFDPSAFQSRKNFFAGRNVSALVLEVPTPLIGLGSGVAGPPRRLATCQRLKCPDGGCR